MHFLKFKPKSNFNLKSLFLITMVIFCAGLFFVNVGTASAIDYYVSTSGSNSNSGTSTSNAWATPSYAAQQAQAGDTIYLMDGTWYNEHVVFANSGTEGNPITITSYNGTPTLDGVDKTGTGIWIPNDLSFIDITGNLVMKNYNDGMYIGGGASHINIMDLTITSLDGWGVYIRPNTSYITLDNTRITHTYAGALLTHLAGHNDYDIRHITITNNIMDDNNHDSINIYGNNKDVLIENNLITNASYGAGIMVHDFGNERIVIRNNTIIDSTRGIWLVGVDKCLVEGNTILDSYSAYGLFLYTHENILSWIQNVTIRDNVIKNSDRYGVFVYSSAGVPIENILFEDNSIENTFRFRGSGISNIKVKDMLDARRTFVVFDIVSNLEIEFTDDRRFSVNGEGEYSSYSITSTGTYVIDVIGVDITLPTITSHSPSGTDIAINTNISVNFSEAMNQSSAQNSFSILPNVSGSFTWNSNQIIFNPSSDLSNNIT